MFDFLLNFQHLRLCFPSCTTAGDTYFSSKWFHRTVCWWCKCIFSKFHARSESTRSVSASSKFNSALIFTIVMFYNSSILQTIYISALYYWLFGEVKGMEHIFFFRVMKSRAFMKQVRKVSHKSPLTLCKQLAKKKCIFLIHLVC